MIWLTKTDLYKLVKGSILERIIDDDDAILNDADRLAMAEVQGYLRARYNVQAIFSTKADQRDPLMIGIVSDVLLYHLCARLPEVPKTREDRYNESKRMLDDIKKGTIDLGLPSAIDDSKNPNTFFYGSQTKRNND